MIERFPHNPENYPDKIVVPGVFPEPTGRQDDKHKPSIFDIEGALKILENEENGNFDGGEDEPTFQ